MLFAYLKYAEELGREYEAEAVGEKGRGGEGETEGAVAQPESLP